MNKQFTFWFLLVLGLCGLLFGVVPYLLSMHSDLGVLVGMLSLVLILLLSGNGLIWIYKNLIAEKK